ncbi:MAG: hypothetical protein J7L42_02315 [Elusimicrobia bacterium]|nr:hypothetical protein [Elusimicrobiota bacterium]
MKSKKVKKEAPLLDFSPIILLIFIFISASYGAFMDMGFSARGGAMAGAYTTYKGRGDLVFYNPAGISGIERQEISFFYARPFAGLNNVDFGITSVCLAMPLYTKGVFAVAYSQFNAGDSKDKLYQEYMIIGSLSYRLSRKFLVGFSLKNLTHKFFIDDRSFSLGDETFDSSTNASGNTFDFGLNWKLSGTLTFALSYQNFIKADVGIHDEDIVPSILRTGLEWRKGRIAIVYNCDIRAQKWGQKNTISYGFEWDISRVLSFRAGATDFEKDFGFGINTKIFGDEDLIIDYNYSIPSEISGATTHRIALTLRRGEIRRARTQIQQVPHEEEEYVPDEGEEIIIE